MKPDICIARLTMNVDSQDGSYMPSKVKISVGDSLDRLRTVDILNIKLNNKAAADVTLLQDFKEVGTQSNALILPVDGDKQLHPLSYHQENRVFLACL